MLLCPLIRLYTISPLTLPLLIFFYVSHKVFILYSSETAFWRMKLLTKLLLHFSLATCLLYFGPVKRPLECIFLKRHGNFCQIHIHEQHHHQKQCFFVFVFVFKNLHRIEYLGPENPPFQVVEKVQFLRKRCAPGSIFGLGNFVDLLYDQEGTKLKTKKGKEGKAGKVDWNIWPFWWQLVAKLHIHISHASS